MEKKEEIRRGTMIWTIKNVSSTVVFGALMFLAAGRLDWIMGWVFVAIMGVNIVAMLAPVLAGWVIMYWAMTANPFFSATVRIQADRGHAVVSRGPYRLVRHPGYAAAVVIYAALPILLGSVCGFVPMIW